MLCFACADNVAAPHHTVVSTSSICAACSNNNAWQTGRAHPDVNDGPALQIVSRLRLEQVRRLSRSSPVMFRAVQVFNIACFTHHGSVAAAEEWGAPIR